jgi:hypothetical protein
LWDDNYLSLLPGESRTIAVDYAGAHLEGARPALSVAVQGWNAQVSP